MKKLSTLSFLLLLIFSCKKDDLSSIDETINIRNNKADLLCRVRGNGSSKIFILVLHGGPGSNGLEYSTGKYAELLEQKFAMAYLDQRGQGVSQGYKTSENLTMDQLVKDVVAVNKTLKFKYGNDLKIYLLGHSWGGTLGTAVMTNKEGHDAFEGWIESDGAHDLPMLNKAAVKLFKEVAETEVKEGSSVSFWNDVLSKIATIDTNKTISDADETWINQKGHASEDELAKVNKILKPTQGNHGKYYYGENIITTTLIGKIANATISSKNNLSQYSLTDQLNKITKPTLLLWGKYDFVVPPRLGYSAYDKLGSSNKKLVMFDYSGHSPMSNEPEKFSNEIIEFISKIESL